MCRVCLCWWVLRDKVSPPTSDAILFVAHPDDDTLFFHTFIKRHKPYVVLCTTGWSLRRLPCFFRAMRHYGVRFRAYDMETRDTRTELLERHIRHALQVGRFKFCATHNASGEYGHIMHQRVHNAVAKLARIPISAPVDTAYISRYPLPEEEVAEKRHIFNHIYTTERWVQEQYQTWVNNEQLERVVE